MHRGLSVGVVTCLSVGVLASPAYSQFGGSNGAIAFARPGKLMSKAPGGSPKTIATGVLSAPSYSPNGRKIVYTRNAVVGGFPMPSSFVVWIASANGSGKKQLAQVEGVNPEPSFSPNGKRVLYTNYDGNPRGDRRLFTVGIDGKGRKQFAPTVGGSMQDASWGSNGRIAYVGGPSNTPAKLRTINANGAKSSIKTLAPSLTSAESPDWSPNGRALVFVHAPELVNTRVVYRVNANGSGLKKLADYGAEMAADEPVWSPNGKKVAFHREDYSGGTPFLGIWTMNANGTGKQRVDATGFDPAWQPR